ncbi:hypothetical protein DENIS_2693 [Desulfonema ishimotonii]|uniref:Uncharacterized protein n=1 Tax=Desulfonema ishimotonii TaxID=45657 RepID=A0A401FXP2_9BACT|nr:hypothetical protein [Desulfonema ishimotonii]GBC61731.1 hypothetical protein DENIS_2693 [Desulfonema ishimotonii]
MQNNSTLNIEKLADALEPLIRKIIREELERIIRKEQKTFYLNPDMPLHDDLSEIHKRKIKGENKFYSHEEVWGE